MRLLLPFCVCLSCTVAKGSDLGGTTNQQMAIGKATAMFLSICSLEEQLSPAFVLPGLSPQSVWWSECMLDTQTFQMRA